MKRNLILAVDSYKSGHWKMLPPGTTGSFSYVEARNKEVGSDFTVFFGLQAIIREYLTTPITMADVDEAERLFAQHGDPFNRAGWERIINVHNGLMPVTIRAVAEGSVVPNGNCLMTIESTDPELPWIASYLETLLLRVWYPITVATRSYQAKQIIRDSMLRTATDLTGLQFKLHDFGARGVSSGESAALGGLAHLVNFAGSDTMEALQAAWAYYDTISPSFSIPAAEHSTITSWGKNHEVDAYRNILRRYAKPGSMVAVVSDSYDIFNAIDNLWGKELKQEVINSGATIVIRPDSGDPVQMVTDVHRHLDAAFGSTLNSKGFKVLNNVRVIQGDGLDNPAVIRAILGFLEMHKFSAENVAFGMGGGLLQKVNRDTLGFAMKCSAVKVDDEWRDVFKEAPGKESKKGRLTLVRQGGEYKTIRLEDRRPGIDIALQRVYDNGFLYSQTNLAEIRQNTGLWE